MNNNMGLLLLCKTLITCAKLISIAILQGGPNSHIMGAQSNVLIPYNKALREYEEKEKLDAAEVSTTEG